MNFMDTIKRSLGFEDSEPGERQNRSYNPNGPARRKYQSQNNFRPSGTRPPRFDDVEPIIPEQPFYEIVLIRPKTIDDINYVVDQVIEEKNPVIIDLSFLQNESPSNFKLAGEKIKQMRANYGAQALLLSRTDDKNLIMVSPKKVTLVKKN